MYNRTSFRFAKRGQNKNKSILYYSCRCRKAELTLCPAKISLRKSESGFFEVLPGSKMEEHNHPNEAISILVEKSISRMEERSVENPDEKVAKIRRQVEEELFSKFSDAGNFHLLLKEELGSAENIEKRVNRFKKRKITSVSSEKVAMEPISERNYLEE